MIPLGLFSNNTPPPQLSTQLKGKCVEYARKHLEEDFLESEFGEELTKEAQEDKTGENLLVGGQDWIRQMDNYILYGETEGGERVLNEIIANAKLNAREKDILAQWREDGFSSLFEIKEVASDKVVAMDVVAEVNYEIYFNVPAKKQEIVKGIIFLKYLGKNLARSISSFFNSFEFLNNFSFQFGLIILTIP